MIPLFLHNIGDINSFVDIGFVVLVAGASISSLIHNSKSSQRRSKRWIDELRGLEELLRELITEAGHASNHLDQNLLRRKQELELLLAQVEEKTLTSNLEQGREYRGAYNLSRPEISKSSFPKIPSSRNSQRPSREEISENLPNESWLQTSTHRNQKQYSLGQEQESEEEIFLDELVESKSDTVTLSSHLQKHSYPERKTQRANGVRETKSDLSRQIEVTTLPRQKTQRSYDPPLDPTQDPVTYKIAERLLREAKTPDMVAKKLGLPLAEMKVLEKLVRNSVLTDPSGETRQSPREPSSKNGFPQRGGRWSSEQGRNQESAFDGDDEDENDEIVREAALV